MAIFDYKDKKPYRTKREVLDLFGLKRVNIMRAIQRVPKRPDNWLVFIRGPKKNDKGGWLPHRPDADWLNHPIDCDWNYFMQLQLTGEPLEHATKRQIARADEKNQAIFIKEEDGPNKGKYVFYGVYQSELLGKASGVCVFRRIATTLDPADWTESEGVSEDSDNIDE
jgi:hypothetical protein